LRSPTLPSPTCASWIPSAVARSSLKSFATRRPSPPSAEEVDVRTHLRERVAGRVDAIHPWDGVEDDLPALRLLVIDAGGQRERAEGKLGAGVRPGHAGVAQVGAGPGHRQEDAEPHRSLSQPRADLLEEEMRGFPGGGFVREVLRSRLRPNAEPAVAAGA